MVVSGIHLSQRGFPIYASQYLTIVGAIVDRFDKANVKSVEGVAYNNDGKN
jgi:hypothetical protein